MVTCSFHSRWYIPPVFVWLGFCQCGFVCVSVCLCVFVCVGLLFMLLRVYLFVSVSVFPCVVGVSVCINILLSRIVPMVYCVVCVSLGVWWLGKLVTFGVDFWCVWLNYGRPSPCSILTTFLAGYEFRRQCWCPLPIMGSRLVTGFCEFRFVSR